MTERIPLTQVAGKIQEQTGIVVSGAYRKLYHAVLDGRLPAKKGTDGRHTISSDHLSQAATILGQLPDWVEQRIAARDQQREKAA